MNFKFGYGWRWALCMLALVLLGFVSAGAVLSLPAALAQQADAVVVLGGGGSDGARYTRGCQLVSDNCSGRMLLINPSDASSKDALRRMPAGSVQIDRGPRNTWQEAQAVRVLMQANGWKSVLIVSDPPHLLRVRYAFVANFRGTGLAYTLVATHPPWWSAWRWWANPVSASFVHSEVLKLGYYLLHYRFGFF